MSAVANSRNPRDKLSRWYFGGLASAGAACCTHPLDLLKVHLQTQQEGKLSIVGVTLNIIKKQGEWKPHFSKKKKNAAARMTIINLLINPTWISLNKVCVVVRGGFSAGFLINGSLELKIPNKYCK